MTAASLRVGIYAAGKTASAVDRSLDALRTWAAARSEWEVVEEYFDDVASGARDDFERLMADAEGDRLDLVLFRSLAEFLPLGTLATVRHLAELVRRGVRFASRTEPHISTLGVAGEIFAQALHSLEAQERLRFSAHLRHRLGDARRTGRGAGRPRLALETRLAIARMRREGRSITATAEALGVARSTVNKYQDVPVGDYFEQLPDRAARAILRVRRD